ETPGQPQLNGQFLLPGPPDLILPGIPHGSPGALPRGVDHPAALAAPVQHVPVLHAVGHVPGLVDDQHLRQHTVVVLPQGAGEDRAGPVDDDPPPVVPLRRRHQQPVPPEAGRKAPIGPAETLQRLPLTGAG
ncbi:Manganese transport regulator MntR, partial [Dysosmobacter welbionis]